MPPRTPVEYLPLGARGSGSDVVLENDAGEQVRLWLTTDAFPRLVLDVPNSAILAGGGAAPPAPLFGVQFNVMAFGALGNGVADDTAAIQAALTAGAGRTVAFPKPATAYLVTSTLTVAAGTTLLFDSAVVRAGAAFATGLFSVGAANIRVTGSVIIDLNGNATPGFVGSASTFTFTSDAYAVATNAPSTPSNNNYLFKFVQSSFVKIGGHVTTTGNSPWLVYVDRGVSYDISGIDTPPISVDDGVFAVIFCTDTTSTNSLSWINVHDCRIDGGGHIAQYAPVFIGTIGSNIAVSHVTVSNVKVTNTISTADGIDLICCNFATVTNCTFSTVMYGVGIAGGAVIAVTGVIGFQTRGVVVGVGDGSTPMDTSIVTVSNCLGYGCGTGTVPYAFLVNTGNNKNCSAVRFVECSAFATPGAYAVVITKTGTGTVSDIEFEDCNFVTGTTGVVNDTVSGTNTSVVRYRYCKGINPKGNLAGATPAVPASTVALPNNTGYDCTVIVFTGVGVTVSAIAIGGTATGYSLAASSTSVPLRIPAGQTITLTYAGGTPTWSFFGE